MAPWSSIQSPDQQRALAFDLHSGAVQDLSLPVPVTVGVALTPDGSATYDPSTNILSPLDGRSGRRIAASGAFVGWSSDGHAALFASSGGLHAVDIATGEAKVVIAQDVQDSAWSPDGTRVAYISKQTLSVLDVAKGESRVIAPPPARSANAPKLRLRCPGLDG